MSDFDNVVFHVSTPEAKSRLQISIRLRCYRELVQYGAEQVLQREYGPYIVAPEPGYEFSVVIDLTQLPAEPEARAQLVMQLALMKRNVMAAPFERAFDDFAARQEVHQEQQHQQRQQQQQQRPGAARIAAESAPEGLKEAGDLMAIHYRDEEAIYIKASHDRVTVIFSTIFREETDRIFGKVFLQEFVDARRRAIQNAPQVLFRNDPPLELQSVPGISQTKDAAVGYVTFGTLFLWLSRANRQCSFRDI